jgi:hypothetical protein
VELRFLVELRSAAEMPDLKSVRRIILMSSQKLQFSM